MQYIRNLLRKGKFGATSNYIVKAVDVHGLDLTRAPLYERKPPWWAGRWLSRILAGGCLISIPLQCEFVLHNWTEPVPSKEDNSMALKEFAAASSQPAYALRPIWQRGLYIVGVIAFNSMLVSALVFGRSRIIRRYYTFNFPHEPSARSKQAHNKSRVFFQTASHKDDRGMLYPSRHCRLIPSSDGNEVIFQSDGIRGDFRMLVNGATVLGKSVSKGDAVSLIMDTWRKESGVQGRLGGWKNGPVTHKK